MVVVQDEPFPVVLGQFALRVEGGQPRGSGFLPGRGVLVVGDVEQVHGPAGQEPAVQPALDHAPHHRGYPAAPAQAAQHPSYFLLVQGQHRGQVGHAGQGHPGDDSQESFLFVGQLFPLRHYCISAPRAGFLPLFPGPVHPASPGILREVFVSPLSGIRREDEHGLTISCSGGGKRGFGATGPLFSRWDGWRRQWPSSGPGTALWTQTRAMPQVCRVLASQVTTR